MTQTGGSLNAEGVSVTVPANVVGPAGGTLSLEIVEPASVSQPAAGFQLGARAFNLSLDDAGTSVAQPAFPLLLTYNLTPSELALAQGDLQRLTLATWVDLAWVALPCRVSTASVECAVGHLSLFALVVAPAPSGELDGPLANGRFYKQANGFSGAGDFGYAVVDDKQASFWTEFQRLGGVDAVGYPISQRFEYEGFLSQGFQKLVLQWRPELGQAVPINVFDELSERGFDAWLEPRHQVPRSPDLTQDLGLPWDAVVERHLSMLEAYPALAEFYATDPEALTQYGLPLSVQAYGPFSTVPLQRGTLQLWTTDSSSAAAGTVVVGNGGDVAKEAGLWPRDAVVPSGAPLLTAQVEGE